MAGPVPGVVGAAAGDGGDDARDGVDAADRRCSRRSVDDEHVAGAIGSDETGLAANEAAVAGPPSPAETVSRRCPRWS